MNFAMAIKMAVTPYLQMQPARICHLQGGAAEQSCCVTGGVIGAREKRLLLAAFVLIYLASNKPKPRRGSPPVFWWCDGASQVVALRTRGHKGNDCSLSLDKGGVDEGGFASLSRGGRSPEVASTRHSAVQPLATQVLSTSSMLVEIDWRGNGNWAAWALAARRWWLAAMTQGFGIVAGKGKTHTTGFREGLSGCIGGVDLVWGMELSVGGS